MAKYPQKLSRKVQIPHIHFASQVTHLEESTKTNHPLNRTLVKSLIKNKSINDIDVLRTLVAKKEILNSELTTDNNRLSHEQRIEILTGDRKFYKLSTDGESASLAKDQPIQQLNGGRIRVDINGVPYADYNIENDLSNISIPIKNGDSIGVTCLSLNSGSRFVSFHVVCNVGPIDSGPLYEGERKAWTISTGSSDYTKELPWLRLEAEKGNPVAEDALGYIYQHGLGVMKNTSEAVIWYKRSADHGNINALERLKNLVK